MPLPERHALTESAFVQTFRNLTGVPSYHYDAVFGRIVHEQFASARPAVVALELPASFRPALEWAAGCWPTPVAAFERGRRSAMGMVMPFVPGDSIFEAFRLASQAGIEVALIDVDVSVPGEQRPPPTLALAPEFAARPGDDFFDAADALNRREQPLVSDLVREAAMASALAALMAQHVSVLWVGGFAHWARIVERLRCRDFAAPDTVPAPRRRFTRARLGPSALVRLTGQYPSMVAAFARAPQAFDPFDAMRMLLHEAAKPEPDGQGTPPVGEARKMLPSEPAAAIDLARTGLYARNLAATARISEQPQLAELVLAASATIGPRYAARLFELATAEHVSTPGRALDALTFEVDPHTRGSDQVEAGFCFRGRRLSAEPWFPVPWPILDPPDVAQLTREARDAHYEGLPDARPGEAFHWHAYPPDQDAYEEFVRYALRRASQSDPLDGPSLPFVSGLEGGLDVRTTIRFWHEDQVYVRRHLQRIGIHPERRDRLDESRGGLRDSARRRGTRTRVERSRFDRHRLRVPCGWARDDRQTGTVGGDTPDTRVVVRHARPSHVRDTFWLRSAVGSRHHAARGSGEGTRRRVRVAGAGVPVLRRQAVRLLQPVRAERSHPRAGAVAQGAPAMVPARPPVRHAPRAPSLLAPALAERQSVAGVAGAPGGARGTPSRSAKGARRGGAPSGGPASA